MRRCTGEIGECVRVCVSTSDGLCSEIGREIKKSQQLIVEYKEELKQSRVIRRHRQEYDAMAKVIIFQCFNKSCDHIY